MDFFNIHTHIAKHPESEILSTDVHLFSSVSKSKFLSVGIHPWYLTDHDVENQLEILRKAIENKQVVAIGECGFDKLKDSLNNYEIIINTVPILIFKKEELEEVHPKTLIIDLASKPGGIDFDTAQKLGINTIHALSLPGKYSPQSAANFIEEAINRTII